jgi:integrase
MGFPSVVTAHGKLFSALTFTPPTICLGRDDQLWIFRAAIKDAAQSSIMRCTAEVHLHDGGSLHATALLRRAGLEALASPHGLRHAHASHAIDGGASLPEVQETLGDGNVATTCSYLQARPGGSSGLRLDDWVFLR